MQRHFALGAIGQQMGITQAAIDGLSPYAQDATHHARWRYH